MKPYGDKQKPLISTNMNRNSSQDAVKEKEDMKNQNEIEKNEKEEQDDSEVILEFRIALDDSSLTLAGCKWLRDRIEVDERLNEDSREDLLAMAGALLRRILEYQKEMLCKW